MKLMTSLSALPVALFALAATAASSDNGTCSSAETASLGTTGQKDIVEMAVAAGDFKTLATALEAAKLIDTLKGEGPFTVFAPTDQAFARLPKGTLESLLKPESRATLTNILTFHVVPGRVLAADVVKLSQASAANGQRIAIDVNEGSVTVAGCKVVKTDIACKNGVIHVVDAVLMPATKDIVGIASEAGSFKTLVAAVKAGGLVETLMGKGPFTVFAPTDAAFAALPEGTLESLLKPENKEQLVAILKNHVLPGRIYSDQLGGGMAATLLGTKLDVQIQEASAFINQTRVSTADIDATNGVIHVIDQVLLPKAH